MLTNARTCLFHGERAFHGGVEVAVVGIGPGCGGCREGSGARFDVDVEGVPVSAVIVWASMSSFVTVMLVPGLTAWACWYLKPLIRISAAAAGGESLLDGEGVPSGVAARS